MNYAVPNPPMDVLVKKINDSHMKVSWSLLTLVEARGWITNYTVYYKPRPASGGQYNFTTVPHNLTSVVIGGLLSEETYVVQVSASTAAGEGVRSEEVSVNDMQSSGE